MKLGSVAAVRSGLVLSRKQAKRKPSWRYSSLNLRSINAAGGIEKDMLDVFDASEQLNAEYLTQPGDIIVRLSAPYTAVLIDRDTSGYIISSNFAIIRTDVGKLLPEYLFWLLNTAESRKRIFENATSNMLASIKPSYFSDLEIDPLSLEDQKTVAQLNGLARREAELLRQLADEKNKYYAQLINHVHTDKKRGK